MFFTTANVFMYANVVRLLFFILLILSNTATCVTTCYFSASRYVQAFIPSLALKLTETH